MRLRRLAALPLLALALTACGGSDAGPSSEPTSGASAGASSGTSTIGGSVSDDLKTKPVVTVPTDAAPTTLLTKDIVVGDGETAGTSGDVTVQYLGLLYADGTEFDSSWKRGQPATFPLTGVIPGFAQGITGMKVGGRREIVIPSALGYGAAGSPPTIPANADLIFVVDLVSLGKTAASASAAPAVAKGGTDTIAGSVTADLKTKPVIEIPTGAAPTALLTKDVVAGDGAIAGPGRTVQVQYVGVLYADGKEFDSSWKRGQPASFSLDGVIPGFAQGIDGMKVGGRREIVIPAALGYGAQGSGADIPPNADLIFIVDLLAVS